MTTPPDDAIRARTDDVVDRALALLLDHDMAGFAGLWAPDGTITFPFAAAGYPTQVVGRAAITEYLASYTDLFDVREVAAQTRHHTPDPHTVVVEFEIAGIAVARGAPYRMRYVCVITVDTDGITSYRDYWSPLAAAEILGATTGDLAATITRSDR